MDEQAETASNLGENSIHLDGAAGQNKGDLSCEIPPC